MAHFSIIRIGDHTSSTLFGAVQVVAEHYGSISESSEWRRTIETRMGRSVLVYRKCVILLGVVQVDSQTQTLKHGGGKISKKTQKSHPKDPRFGQKLKFPPKPKSKSTFALSPKKPKIKNFSLEGIL